MAKFNDIRELAQQNARWVSNSPKDWMNYLDVAARLYRYSFTDTLLIHAQRPDATACAELELWNQKMSRWVNRGAKGIALLDIPDLVPSCGMCSILLTLIWCAAAEHRSYGIWTATSMSRLS